MALRRLSVCCKNVNFIVNQKPKVLKQMGYRCAVDFEPHEYSTRDVELSIDRERPVLMRGASEKYVVLILNISFDCGGHVWL